MHRIEVYRRELVEIGDECIFSIVQMVIMSNLKSQVVFRTALSHCFQ